MRRRLTISALLVIGALGCAAFLRPAPGPGCVAGSFTAEVRNDGPDARICVRSDGLHHSLELKGVNVRQALLRRLDGQMRLIVLTTDPADAVRMFSIDDGLREVWRGISGGLRPWKLDVGDVDGDGKGDIAVGVYKKARFHPVMANRPFIYGWDGEDVYPKWLGSRLSRPFTDFVLADFGSGVRLVAVEETRDGKNELAVYKWDGFGFVGEWQGACAKSLSELTVLGSPGGQVLSVKADGSSRTYVWDGKGLRRREADS